MAFGKRMCGKQRVAMLVRADVQALRGFIDPSMPASIAACASKTCVVLFTTNAPVCVMLPCQQNNYSAGIHRKLASRMIIPRELI
jgi:hypothetical protein